MGLLTKLRIWLAGLPNCAEEQDVTNYHEWCLLKNIYFIAAGGIENADWE